MRDEEDSEFESWYLKEHSRILSALVLMTGDLHLSQDAVDEAFVRAYDRWHRVRSLESPSGWTFKVALNLVRRLTKRANRVFAPSETGRETALPSKLDEIWKMVNRLSSRQREVIVLRYIGDLTEAQVASVLGVTRGTVSQILRAAHSRLGEMIAIGHDCQGEECNASR